MSGDSPAVLVDAENVRRSVWPNVAPDELVELCAGWAATEGCRALIVFDGSAPTLELGEADSVELVATGAGSADDWIAREAEALRRRGATYWLVTSDRELRTRAGSGAARTIGGGTFARTILGRRSDE